MKKNLIILIFFVSVILFPQSEYFRNHDGGGGFDLIQTINCLTEHERNIILKQNRETYDSLLNNNLLSPEILENNSIVKFDFPLKASKNFEGFNFYGISNFVDHNQAFPNQLRDYNGGTRTYDVSSGYNHKGTDYFLWPFSWYSMDNDFVEIVAAESGVIVGKLDGNFDRNCSMNNLNWNAVYIRHSDNSVAWYGHMKRNSVIAKAVGQTVEKGEYLGVVGSSGSSTGPHLHLEVYNSSNQLIDPYQGLYNLTTDSSWWAEQEPYYDSRINTILTHSAPPVFNPCPEQETLNIKNEFKRGDAIYYVTYYKDQLQNQVSQYRLYYPNGTIANQWNHSSPQPFYSASYWYWSNTIPQNYPFGEYTFTVTFNNKTYEHKFNVVEITGIENEEENYPTEFALLQNFPNPFNPFTVVNYQLAVDSKVFLKVFDVLGNEVKTLVEETQNPGNYSVNFDAAELSAGIYFYQLKTNSYIKTRKMILIK